MARTKTDKIFDNTFEESEYDGRGTNFELNSAYTSEGDSEERIHESMLMELINKLIDTSKYKSWNLLDKKTNKIPKLNKSQINEIYTYIAKEVKNYSRIDVFSVTSDYFDIQPQKFYNSLSNSHKSELLDELNKKMNIYEKKNIQSLF